LHTGEQHVVTGKVLHLVEDPEELFILGDHLGKPLIDRRAPGEVGPAAGLLGCERRLPQRVSLR
jgi:hypothetical protein